MSFFSRGSLEVCAVLFACTSRQFPQKPPVGLLALSQPSTSCFQHLEFNEERYKFPIFFSAETELPIRCYRMIYLAFRKKQKQNHTLSNSIKLSYKGLVNNDTPYMHQIAFQNIPTSIKNNTPHLSITNERTRAF